MTCTRATQLGGNFINNLCLDLRDVRVWLNQCYPGIVLGLVADVNWTYQSGDIADAVPFCARQDAGKIIQSDTKRAMSALGYRIAPSGMDVFQIWAAPHDHLSAHQLVRCLGRVKAALAGNYQPPEDYSRPRPPVGEHSQGPVDDNF